uniref:Uncharacterized protein n=1 Tax=Magallana gigas TaxID=29159 RepID=K1R838_MAGGI
MKQGLNKTKGRWTTIWTLYTDSILDSANYAGNHKKMGFCFGISPQQVINGLRRIGHNITMSPSAGSIVQGILQHEEGKITANADYRKRGVPDGY